MNTVTASFDTTVRQMTDMFQRKKNKCEALRACRSGPRTPIIYVNGSQTGCKLPPGGNMQFFWG